MNRRQFLRAGLAGIAAGAVSACAPAFGGGPPPPLSPTDAATPSPGTTTAGVRGDVAPGTLLRNEDAPGFYVRFINDFPALDPGRWQLAIKGLVEAPTTLTLDLIRRNLPLVEQNTRMKCVEGWSRPGLWGGFTYAALVALVNPMASATYVHFRSEDGYYEIVSISELQRERALFATHLDGAPLGAKHGAPLRLLLPWAYGYKGAKTIHTLEFTEKGGKGYWPAVGGYSAEGRIQSGVDVPLDLGFKSRPITGGEITDY